MAGMTGVEESAKVTRERVTRAKFDISETFLCSTGQDGETRKNDRVSPQAAQDKGANSYRANFVRLFASGAWGLAPLQLTLSQLQEFTAGAGSAYLPASLGAGADRQIDIIPYTKIPKFRQPTGTGMASIPSGANPSGSDLFFTQKVTAGTSWNQSGVVSSETHINDLQTEISAIESTIQPLDIFARSTNVADADSGFCLRFTIKGSKHHSLGLLAVFAFGQYAVLFRGDGQARLWMYAPHVVGGTPQWRSLKTFRWSRPNQVTGSGHTLCFFPHLGETGEKHLSIISLAMDTTTVSSAGGASTLSPAQGNSGAHSTTEELWTYTKSVSAQLDVADPGKVTTQNRWYLLERRDHRGEWQVSKLTYPTGGSDPAGKLIGDPHGANPGLAFGFTPSSAWTVNKLSRESGAATIATRIKDAKTDSTVTIDFPYVLFDFYSDGASTPLLYGYSLNKAPLTITSAPGEITSPVKSVRIQSGGSDPRTESARIEVEDLTDAWPRLRNRSRLSVRVTTTYTPPGGTEQVVTLFRGAAISPRRTKKGTSNGTEGFSTAARVYPSAEWSEYSLGAKGMWERLSSTTTRSTLSMEIFSVDPSAPRPIPDDGRALGWKVTDAIRKLLSIGGFPDSMMRIPDLGVRLNPGIGTGDTDRIFEPGTSAAQMAVDMARNYLGRWLVFDYNDGAEGKWTLVGPPAGTGAVTPVFAFTKDAPTVADGSLVLPHALHAYPANTAPTFGRATSYTLPPQKNHIWAYTAVNVAQAGPVKIDNHIFNVLSYAVPGATISPDATGGHYMGHEELLTIADPAFWAGGHPLSDQQTQDLVDYVLIRAFVATAMARKIQPIRAPLVFIQDPVHSGWRPLRFYDPVTLDGVGYYVRSVTIAYDNDGMQMADYELERLIPYKPGI